MIEIPEVPSNRGHKATTAKPHVTSGDSSERRQSQTTNSERIIPEYLSELGKQVLRNCQNAYINECGQVIDPCHVYWSEQNYPAKW